ncbi:MAG TPA: hypothetical protein VFJ85_02775 [Acidimicrobiales bacterium]|nr:hypothetical protein [Acidimicrobiales bacterium]
MSRTTIAFVLYLAAVAVFLMALFGPDPVRWACGGLALLAAGHLPERVR